jgi:hypothetical protein
MEVVKEKFGKHIHGIALSKNSNHKAYAYIICVNKEMIGYIQAHGRYFSVCFYFQIWDY